MEKKKKFLAFIPARGGSKRLPKKNKRFLAGKPMIAWTIEVAKACDTIDSVVVSTDDPEIATIAKSYGAEVPFMRPNKLARDTSTTFDTLMDGLSKLERLGKTYDYVVLLQPTSPLRTLKNLSEAVSELFRRGSRSIISVCEVDHHPYWSNVLNGNLSMDSFISDEIKNLRSQDLPTYYRLNGAIYIYEVKFLRDQKSLFPGIDCIAYIMDKNESLDIDSEIDFQLAEIILKCRKQKFT